MNKQIEQESEQVELIFVDKMEELKLRLDQIVEKLTRSGQLKRMLDKLSE